MDCIFCKIAKGEIPSAKVYEDTEVYAFRDIDPQAPTHVLVIPKTHVASANELDEKSAELAGKIFAAIPKIASALGMNNGYRVITNVGEDGCQSVKHLHFHVLGGARLPEHMGI